MNRVEELLVQMSLREPSAELDQRVGESVTRAPLRGSHHRRPSWWGMLAACAVCLLVGVFAGKQWSLRQIGAVGSPPGVTSTEIPERTGADESPAVAAAGVSPGLLPAVERAAEAGVNPDQRTMVSKGTFLLINGQPVRAHRTLRARRVRVYSAETGQFSEIEFPIRRDVVVTSRGI